MHNKFRTTNSNKKLFIGSDFVRVKVKIKRKGIPAVSRRRPGDVVSGIGNVVRCPTIFSG